MISYKEWRMINETFGFNLGVSSVPSMFLGSRLSEMSPEIDKNVDFDDSNIHADSDDGYDDEDNDEMGHEDGHEDDSEGDDDVSVSMDNNKLTGREVAFMTKDGRQIKFMDKGIRKLKHMKKDEEEKEKGKEDKEECSANMKKKSTKYMDGDDDDDDARSLGKTTEKYMKKDCKDDKDDKDCKKEEVSSTQQSFLDSLKKQFVMQTKFSSGITEDSLLPPVDDEGNKVYPGDVGYAPTTVIATVGGSGATQDDIAIINMM